MYWMFMPSLFKVDNPYSIIFCIIGILICKQNVVWCGSKDGFRKTRVQKKLECVLKI